MLTVMCVTVANVAAFGYGLDTTPGGGVVGICIEIHQQRRIVELDRHLTFPGLIRAKAKRRISIPDVDLDPRTLFKLLLLWNRLLKQRFWGVRSKVQLQ